MGPSTSWRRGARGVFRCVHSHLNDAKSHRENFFMHHDRLRMKHHKLLQSRSEKKAMAKSFKALRATDANHELDARRAVYDPELHVRAGEAHFSSGKTCCCRGLLRYVVEFQRAVSRKVVSAALSDSVGARKEFCPIGRFSGRKSSPSKSPSSVAVADDRLPERP